MPTRPTLILSSPQSGESKTAWLARALGEAIRNGTLAPGDRLPPTRLLAIQHGTSRGVVVAAHELLWAEGLIAGKAGAGTTVLPLAPPQRPRTRLHKVRAVAPPPRDLVEEIYEASLAPSRWGDVLGHGARQLGCIGGFLAQVGPGAARIEPVQVHGMDDAGTRAYGEHHWKTDIWTPIGSVLPPGVMQIGDRLLPRDTIVRSEFYNDFLRPNGIGNFIGGILSSDGEAKIAVTLYRPVDAPTIEDRQAAQFERLMPHLQRAIRIQSSLDHARTIELGLAGALDEFSACVALLDEDGRPLFLNRAADAALARGDGLRLRLERFGARDHAAHLRLERAIRLAASPDATASTLVLPRHGSRFVWRALVVPLRPAHTTLGPNGRCLVWLMPGVARGSARQRSVCRLDAIDLGLLTVLRGGTPPAELDQLSEADMAQRLRRLADATGCDDAGEFARAWQVTADPFVRGT